MVVKEMDCINYIYKAKEICKTDNKSTAEFTHSIMQGFVATESLHEVLIKLGFSKDNSVYKNLELLYQE